MPTAKLHGAPGRRPAPTTPLAAPARRPAAPAKAAPAPRARLRPSWRRRLDARRWELAIVLIAVALACLAVPLLMQPAPVPAGATPGAEPPAPLVRTW